MNSIYFKEGIYVLLDNDTNNEICIYHYDNKKNVSLYGGRIQITEGYYNWGRLIVDGIPIVQFKFENQSIVNGLELSEIVSHLNAIQTNGVDTFLENYKKSIAFLYNELKELNQKTESQLTIVQEDSKIKTILSELTKIRDLLLSVLAILFLSLIHI